MFKMNTWRGGLILSDHFVSRSRRPVWNVLTGDDNRQNLEDYGLDQDMYCAWWDNFATQVGCYRFQIVFVYSRGWVKTIRKRYRVDGIIFENGEKKMRLQTKTYTCGQGLNLSWIKQRCYVFHFSYVSHFTALRLRLKWSWNSEEFN